MDAKQWAWIVLHAVLFTLLCKTDTYLSARLRGEAAGLWPPHPEPFAESAAISELAHHVVSSSMPTAAAAECPGPPPHLQGHSTGDTFQDTTQYTTQVTCWALSASSAWPASCTAICMPRTRGGCSQAPRWTSRHGRCASTAWSGRRCGHGTASFQVRVLRHAPLLLQAMLLLAHAAAEGRAAADIARLCAVQGRAWSSLTTTVVSLHAIVGWQKLDSTSRVSSMTPPRRVLSNVCSLRDCGCMQTCSARRLAT